MRLFDIQSEYYYFVNGLRRSGNHLFISWIISNYKKVLYINDVNSKPICNPSFHNKEISDKVIYRESNQFHSNINKNLLSKNDAWTDIDCFIFSMEDKKTDVFYKTIKYFKTESKNCYTVLIIRDILNTIASRLEAAKTQKKDLFLVDSYVTDLWNEIYCDKRSIKFNYNKFILNPDNYRVELGFRLNLTKLSNNVLNRVPQFGLGSSFAPNSLNRSKIIDLLNRYKKYQNNEIFESILEDHATIKILETDFMIYSKIAYMFLTVNDVNNILIWDRYFNNKDTINKFNIYMHPKNKTVVTSFFKQYIIDDLRPTSWGFIIDAYEALFKTAYEDDILNKYFVIVSESDIPITKFNKFYNYLSNDINGKNIIELWSITDYDKEIGLKDLKKFRKQIIKHSAFFVLNRETIFNILKSPYLKLFKKVPLAEEFFLSVVYDTKHFINQIVTYADWDWSKKKKGEYAKKIKKYLKLYEEKRNIRYKEIADEYYKLIEETRKHPRLYHNLANDIINKSLKRDAFFARKFKDLPDYNKKNLIMNII